MEDDELDAAPMGAPGTLDAADIAQNPYYPPPAGDGTVTLPINLDSLRDGPPGSKPFYPYSTLIRSVQRTFLVRADHACVPHSYAIKGSPNQKLLLEDIYYAIESRVRAEGISRCMLC